MALALLILVLEPRAGVHAALLRLPGSLTDGIREAGRLRGRGIKWGGHAGMSAGLRRLRVACSRLFLSPHEWRVNGSFRERERDVSLKSGITGSDSRPLSGSFLERQAVQSKSWNPSRGWKQRRLRRPFSPLLCAQWQLRCEGWKGRYGVLTPLYRM